MSASLENVSTYPLTSKKWGLKRFADIVISVALIVLLLPLFVIIAMAIKLESRGPILFQQARHGVNRRVFFVWKFRSMRHSGTTDSGVLQVRREDPRATRVGRFLRRSSLDELPQLLNVLEGSMSLVGPRPHPIPLDEKYEALIEGYNNRYRVRPGITGWAQVNGYRGPIDGEASMRARLRHDEQYIRTWSLLLDVKILLLTLYKGFFHQNAY
ncbi:MAG: exopolysaccharide biosynthesis polyprenyl glycosylphosphotransferase [Gammaproteobacteria bacterium]|nr:exopolysaccharide biosynthesis polyprenyl glycosylphosphotransferase [Woeseia sp.]MBU2676287.1 exopolysaccharide biosynthesis polyprenyl glycosylphosphotransferase [Gammaproteobacteria bacterium]NNL50022.1 exopolysaccharide biosynthesis polyprenyl glycosylphosphotransferase [Woeseiaceae bacterium]